jgi:RHS repeat-associated protein
MQGAGGVGGLIKATYYGTATTNCFVAFDGNGNVSALINAADGTTAAQYEYGPFGEVIRATGPLAKLNPFRFSTKYQDDETDFLYYGYRYYNPSTGRFIGRDPAEEEGASLLRTGRQSEDQFDANGNWIGETDSVNLYAFVANDPLDAFDYLGMVRIVKDGGGFTIVDVSQQRAKSCVSAADWGERSGGRFGLLCGLSESAHRKTRWLFDTRGSDGNGKPLGYGGKPIP